MYDIVLAIGVIGALAGILFYFPIEIDIEDASEFFL